MQTLLKGLFRAGIVLLTLTASPLMFSQTSTQTGNLPPGWVDGKVHPDQIPDHASYRLVLIHLSSLVAARQDTRIQMIGLSGQDIQTLKNEVALFQKEYGLWKAKAGAQPSQQDDQAAQAIALASRAAILSGLSPSGASKFSQYVEREKARMHVKP